MKIAILIVGEYREFKISINSWNFLNNDNADYWISTWEVSKQNDFIETVSEKDFTNYLPNIKNIGIHPKEKIHISDGNIDTSQAFRFNWMYCYETLLEKMESQNLKYDAMMIIRPDLWLENQTEDFLTDSFITQLKDNTIYHIGPKHKEWINDLMFYGKFDVMWDFLSKVQYKPIEHNNLGKIKYENYNTEEHKGTAVIVRPSARIIKQKNYSDALFRRFDMEWTEERDINFKQ